MHDCGTPVNATGAAHGGWPFMAMRAWKQSPDLRDWCREREKQQVDLMLENGFWISEDACGRNCLTIVM